MHGHPFPKPRGTRPRDRIATDFAFVSLSLLSLAVLWFPSLSRSLLCTLSPFVCAGIAEDIGGFLLPPQDQSKEIVVGEVDKEVSFEDFERALLRGDVSTVFS